MFHPNARYGNPAEFRARIAGMPIATVARRLHRHPRSITNWIQERERVPWWAVEVLRLQDEIAFYELRWMGIKQAPRAVINMDLNSRRTSDRDASSTTPPAADQDLAARASG